MITHIGKGRPSVITDCDYDGNGCDLYPGFIDAHTHLGLTTNGVGVESEDFKKNLIRQLHSSELPTV